MEIKDFNNINFTASYYSGQAGKKQAFNNLEKVNSKNKNKKKEYER